MSLGSQLWQILCLKPFSWAGTAQVGKDLCHQGATVGETGEMGDHGHTRMLWPKIGDVETGLKLALVCTIKPENLEPEELTLNLLGWLQENYPASLQNYYGLTAHEMAEESYSLLLAIGKRRGCLRRGGEVDLRRAAELIGNDFRQGKLGAITLDPPEITSASPVSS